MAKNKPDGRARTSAANGRKGGGPKGARGPQAATRAKLAAIQRSAELDAETVIEQMARGALYDVGRLHYSEAGQELYDADGPLLRDPVTRLPVHDTTGQVVHEWRKGDVKRSWSAGDLKPLHELDEADRAMIAGFEVVMKNATAGDGVIDRVLKVKLVDRSKYVEMAAKYHSLLVERVELTDTVGSRLDAAREAARKRNAKGNADS